MKQTMLSAVSAATLLLCTPAAASPASDRAEIERLEHELAAITDPAKLADFYAPGSIPVLYEGLAPGVYKGNAAIVESYARQMVGMKSVKARFLQMEIDVSGDLATVYSVQEFHTGWADEIERRAIFRMTDILKRMDGRWRIVHQHTSYPADAATGKALFELNPFELKR